MKKSIRKFLGVTGALCVLSVLPVTAYANTQAHHEFQSTISVDNTVQSKPIAITAMDGQTLTTYMPIWYVDEALKAAGYIASWNGSSHTWSLTRTVPANYYSKLSLGTGDTNITVNGTLVKKVNTIVIKDPAGGADAQDTTYMPIYYINQLFKSVGIFFSWNGHDWNLQNWGGVTQLSGNTSVPVGTADSLTLTGTKGDTITIPWSDVTTSIHGHATATIDRSGHFVANTPGQYTVHTTFGGTKSSITIDVYNPQPASVNVTLGNGILDTNTASKVEKTDSVAVQVVDANNDTIANFNGTVQLSIPSSGGTLSNEGTAEIQNGVGTLTLTAPSSEPVQDESTITASKLISDTASTTLNTIHYGTVVEHYTSAQLSN
ncbi:hypothetical protein [Alicyclobacillus mengziensis]|uniref:Uncharacterized protein n=1 Tax=Alicyclobacillus mengziensis TaxID=2931921 RepID=A0A9X7Z6Y5_9BACL|nr:hypothetical protein [Alicyclobacillus mengziensis]QSO48439.1 hypothetical protein JZ786_05475 [Alicyclobacillus mengziensis]